MAKSTASVCLIVAVLRISTPYGFGSGCFVAPNLILTAGHVVQPHTPAPVPAAFIRISLPDGSTLQPAGVLPHPRWSTGTNADGDMAVLRVAELHPELVLPIVVDLPAANLGTSIQGFDGNGTAVNVAGTVNRVPHPGGFDAMISSDLAFPGGVSGGPMFAPDETVFAIATWSPPAVTPNSFIGIPLLNITFNWLRMHCP